MPLRCRLRELAAQRPRFGYRRLHVLLRREGIVVNHKRVERLYREEGLAVRRRRRKSLMPVCRGRPALPHRANEQWALDFLQDALASGRKLRVLSVIDVFTREALALEVDTSLPGTRVVRVLDRLLAERDCPAQLVLDNGPELISRVLEEWAHQHAVTLHFIDPGKPIQNAHWRASTVGSVMNASTSIGSWDYAMPSTSWKPGAKTTIASDRTARSPIGRRRSSFGFGSSR
jgi:putative transposase